MIKLFCDKCGKEIKIASVGELADAVHREIKTYGSMFRVLPSHLCHNCTVLWDKFIEPKGEE